MNKTPSVKDLRDRLTAVLARLADDALRDTPRASGAVGGEDIHALARHLGMVMAGATPSNLATVRPGVAGYGSRVLLRDLETGDRRTHHIMSSQAMDIVEDHVSLESPLGDALLGSSVDAEVEIRTPSGPRRLQVLEIRTLTDLLDMLDPPQAEPITGTDG